MPRYHRCTVERPQVQQLVDLLYDTIALLVDVRGFVEKLA